MDLPNGNRRVLNLKLPSVGATALSGAGTAAGIANRWWTLEGCHVTRHIPSLIKEAGFKIEQIDTGYLSPFLKSGSYCFWGIAVPE
jgi:hypothetical protein